MESCARDDRLLINAVDPSPRILSGTLDENIQLDSTNLNVIYMV